MTMEKGSFQPTITYGFVGEDARAASPEKSRQLESPAVNQVPLPSELPARPDLTFLPDHIQRSSAVEALIHQNEDLMARLAVAIRRNSLVEEKLGQYDNTLKQLQERNEVLADQVLVFREKDRVQGQTRQKFEEQLREYKEKVALLEVQYAEYYASSKERNRHLTSNVEQLTRRLGRFLRYRTQVQRLSRKFRRDYKARIQQLEQENVVLGQRLIQEEARLQAVREKLTESIDHIQRQGREAEANQRQLVDHYESSLSQLKESLKAAQSTIAELESRVRDQDALFEQKVDLENQLVASQRAASDSEKQFNEEVRRLQLELADFRREAKEKSLEVDRLTEQSLEEIAAVEDLRLKNKQLEDQVESLQVLWRDAHQQTESLTEKNVALQKLNQQLSTKLNEQRREIENMRSQMDGSGFRATEKIRELEGQVKVLADSNVKLHEEKDSEKSLGEQSRREVMERIENLIAEIQSGFSINPEAAETETTATPPATAP